MPKVVIELTDKPDGKVHIDLTSDPPVEKGQAPTPAQQAAMDCLRGMAGEAACRSLSKEYAEAASQQEPLE